MKQKLAIIVSLISACLLGALSAVSVVADDGTAAYEVCAACHGVSGEGNEDMQAPALAGQARWYMERQLAGFKKGWRGKEGVDDDAFMMTAATEAMSPSEISAALDYIGTLPANKGARTASGNTVNGEGQFGICASCHGASGQGVKSLDAPSLTILSDWYILAQMEKFGHGKRGAAADDQWGGQMVAMGELITGQDLQDILAYLAQIEAQQ